jgi:Phosphotransferase enzyme family
MTNSGQGPIEERLRQDFEDPDVRQYYGDIFGRLSPPEMARRIVKLLPQQYRDVTDTLFSSMSIGAVFGLRTAARDRIVLKVYPKHYPLGTLKSITKIQRHFFSEGFPAPEILGELIPVRPGIYASLSPYIDGQDEDGHQTNIRKELVIWLAEFARLSDAEDFPPIENPFQSQSKRKLWPVPHKSTINFEKTSRGADFLRKRAMRARAILNRNRLPEKLVHLDWGVKNSKFRRKRVVAVFDWDSLGNASEAQMVGQAAAQFTANWDIPTKITPTPEESNLFVDEYEQARGRRFSRKEREVISASGDYLISVVARQEYAEGHEGENTFLHLVRSLGRHSLIEV